MQWCTFNAPVQFSCICARILSTSPLFPTAHCAVCYKSKQQTNWSPLRGWRQPDVQCPSCYVHQQQHYAIRCISLFSGGKPLLKVFFNSATFCLFCSAFRSCSSRGFCSVVSMITLLNYSSTNETRGFTGNVSKHIFSLPSLLKGSVFSINFFSLSLWGASFFNRLAAQQKGDRPSPC